MLKERDVRSILNRLKWDNSFNFEDCKIKYIDRMMGLTTVSCKEIEDIGHKFLFLKGDVMIPMHRVVEIIYRDKIIWKKTKH